MIAIEYKEGQKIRNCVFVKNDAPLVTKKGVRQRKAYFICECGNMFSALISNVKRGCTKGCKNCAVSKTSKSKITHGCSLKGMKTSEYRTWELMKDRCTRPTYRKYGDYGGRGITVCDRWLNSFQNFISDMGLKPAPQFSIERRKNNEGYSPENCYWATRKQQCNNRRSNIMIYYNGQLKTLIQWTDELGLPYHKTRARIKKYNWSPEKAFNT